MLFNTIPFMAMAASVVAITWSIRAVNPVLPKYFLILASFGFYAIWNASDIPLLLLSLLFNYVIAQFIFRSRERTRFWLSFGVVANIALLVWFKVGPGAGYGLPLGISFFTFQQIAYLVSVCRGSGPASIGNYSFVICFFPHLVAGPLVQHKDMVSQLNAPRSFWFKRANLFAGSSLFIIGLSKKVLIADQLGLYSQHMFHLADTGIQLDVISSWIGALTGFLNFYFDFSGYSDMACGIALSVGIRLPLNFYSPFKAVSMDDFWNRWNITVTQFFRVHVFRPLAGKRLVIRRHLAALPITMIVAGLWHGATINFLVWGLLHGVLVMSQHARRLYWRTTPTRRKPRGRQLIGWAETQLLLIVLGCFFQAKTLDGSLAMLRGMVGMSAAPAQTNIPSVLSQTIFEAASLLLQFNFSDTAAQHFNLAIAFLLITTSWAICLIAPNSTELLAKFHPVIDSTNLLRKGLYPNLNPILFRGKELASPRITWVLFLSVIFGLSLLRVMTNTASAFNYYNY